LKTPSGSTNSTPFKELGSFVYRHRRSVIVIWVIALVAVLPIVINVGKSTSLQLGSATGSQLESVRADNVISSQFEKTVPNSTLLIVVTGRNVTSVATQELIRRILDSVNSSKSISGLVRNDTSDVYSPLYRTLASVDKAVYAALKDANSTYHGTQSTSQLRKFAVEYVANRTSLSVRFVNATFNLGQTYNESRLYELAGGIVWNPSEFGVGPSLSTLITSLVSSSRNLTIISFGLNQSSNQNLIVIRTLADSALASGGPTSGVQSVLVTGQDAISYDFGNSIQADITVIFTAAIILLIVATGLFFRSVLTPFITLGTIGVALGISQVFIVVVSTYVAKVDFTVPAILLTILIGVGTDYSVFVIARYREERVKGRSVQEAVETSVTWAGESIATSGATVIISFLSLALTSVVLLKAMGFVVGLGVLVALSVALTLVPAIIGVVG